MTGVVHFFQTFLIKFMGPWPETGEGKARKLKPCEPCGARRYQEGLEEGAGKTGATSSGAAQSSAASSSVAGPHGATSSSKVIEEIKGLASLRDQGVLSPEEFQSAKTALLQQHQVGLGTTTLVSWSG